jgi:hypothetical protein
MRKLLFITLGLLLFAYACENDLKLNADWKDITVVYGILNQKDSVQYLKINKAYLGEGNALIMATIEDSSTYFNNLEVIMEEWKNGQFANKTIIFDTTSVYNKVPGTFYYPRQIIYKTKTRLDSSENNTEYLLKITNKLTGKVISSRTKLIKTFYISKPNRAPFNPVINFTNKEPASVVFKAQSDDNARYFEVYFRFYYTELDTVAMIQTDRSLDYFVGDAVLNDNQSDMSVSYLGESFYSMLKSKIPYNPNMVRKVKLGEEIELYVLAANDDFYTYMQAVKPSNGIVQEKPEFTNIVNGIGIFASRFSVSLTFNLNAASLDSLYYGSYTKNLGFIK